MAIDKITDLVDQSAFDQLTKLLEQLGIAQQSLIDTAAKAALFNNELGNTKTLSGFADLSNVAAQSVNNVATANTNLVETQKAVVTQTQAVVDATKVKVSADADAGKVLIQISGTLDANIKLLVKQKVQLREVSDQIKINNSLDLATKQAKTELNDKIADQTRRQLELKNSISQLQLVIKQQIKEDQAAATSQDAMLARLNQLRKSYNSLTAEERENAAVGGVLLANIKELATATTKINQEQGKYNDSVGNYENAIKSAVSAYVPYGNQIVKSIDLFNQVTKTTESATVATAGFGSKLAAFSIGEFAVAMAAAVYYLSQFRDSAQKSEQFLAGLKNQFLNFGSNVVNAFKGGSKNVFSGFADSFNQGIDAEKAIQNVKNLNEVNDQLIRKKQAQADQDRALSKNQELTSDERIAKLKEAQSIETEIIEMQKSNAQANIDAAIQSTDAVKKLTQGQKDVLASGTEGGIRYANDLVKTGKITETGYQLLQEGYQRQTQALNAANMKLIRQQNDEAKLDLKQAKEINTEELENQKAKLNQAKINAKLIVDDETQSYDARIAALKVYVSRSNQIIDNELKISNSAPKVSATKRDTNGITAATQKTGVNVENNQLTAKIQADELRELQKEYDNEIRLAKEHDTNLIKLQKDTAAQRITEIEQNASDAELALAQQREKGLVTEKQYQAGLVDIAHQSAQDRLNEEVKVLQAIIAEKKASGADTSDDEKNLAGIQKSIIDENTKYGLGQIKTVDDAKKAASDLEIQLLDKSLTAIESYGKAVNAAAEARLKHQSDLLTQQTEAEKTQVQNGVGTAKDKAARLAQIDAQAASQRKVIQDEENKIKRKAAVEDKAAAITAIIINTAVAASKVLGQTGIFGIALEPLVIALGAIQLAVAAAAPIPAYAVGTSSAKGGKSLVGERGTELIIDPQGNASLTPNSATIMDLKAGSKVFTNAETMRMMAKPDAIQYVGGHAIDIQALIEAQKETTAAIRSQHGKAPNKGIVRTGWNEYLQRNGIN